MVKRICVALALFFAYTCVASAEEPGFFPQGTWTASVYGSYAKNFTGELAKLSAGTIGGGYYFIDNMSINAELSGYHNDQHGPDANIAAGDLLLRHHLFHRGRFSFFVDVGGAVSYADHATPYYGTNFNFIIETGAGTTFQLWDNVHLLTGVRYFHLSNAHKEGPAHNPSINALQGYVGLLFKF